MMSEMETKDEDGKEEKEEMILPPNTCCRCLKSFSNKSNLTKHQLKTNSCIQVRSEIFKCQRCQKVFKHKHHLDAHAKKRFSCKPVKSEALLLAEEETKKAIKLAEEKTKQDQIELKKELAKNKRVEKEYKLRQADMIKNPQLRVDTINYNIINNNTINVNLHNMDDYKEFSVRRRPRNPTQEQVADDKKIIEKIMESNVMKEQYKSAVRFLHANPDFPEDRCIVCNDLSNNNILMWKIKEFVVIDISDAHKMVERNLDQTLDTISMRYPEYEHSVPRVMGYKDYDALKEVCAENKEIVEPFILI